MGCSELTGRFVVYLLELLWPHPSVSTQSCSGPVCSERTKMSAIPENDHWLFWRLLYSSTFSHPAARVPSFIPLPANQGFASRSISQVSTRTAPKRFPGQPFTLGLSGYPTHLLRDLPLPTFGKTPPPSCFVISIQATPMSKDSPVFFCSACH